MDADIDTKINCALFCSCCGSDRRRGRNIGSARASRGIKRNRAAQKKANPFIIMTQNCFPSKKFDKQGKSPFNGYAQLVRKYAGDAG